MVWSRDSDCPLVEIVTCKDCKSKCIEKNGEKFSETRPDFFCKDVERKEQMFINRRKYELEKLIAKQRIEHLEKIICPNGHDYKKVGTKTVAYDTLFGNDLYHDIYVCAKCGKMKE